MDLISVDPVRELGPENQQHPANETAQKVIDCFKRNPEKYAITGRLKKLCVLPQIRQPVIKPDFLFGAGSLWNAWFAEMLLIQTTGLVSPQSERCVPCSNGCGPFEDCVSVEGIAGCGNCRAFSVMAMGKCSKGKDKHARQNHQHLLPSEPSQGTRHNVPVESRQPNQHQRVNTENPAVGQVCRDLAKVSRNASASARGVQKRWREYRKALRSRDSTQQEDAMSAFEEISVQHEDELAELCDLIDLLGGLIHDNKTSGIRTPS